ncbi:hypothetical protein Tcan_08971 [Toxocara canis]|uniref:Uncharacterized protein n=1 Tax=Toxocara canis TaxID=6265 RepID=A0A0B2VL71_TOXCA|nr:hypothetical protein Tcan_08971 [Toxocara canis]
MQSVSDSTWSCSGFGLHAPNSDLRSGSGTYPIIYASPSGTISVMLKMGVIVEMTVDRAVRVLCHDTFSSVWNSLGTSACILHPNARIYQHDENVFCNFGTFPNPTYKMGTIVPGGVFFRMPHMPFAYMVSSTAVRGTVAVYLEQNQFPALSYDFTLAIFYAESMNGPEYAHVCNEVVKKARHRRRRDGSITLTINGIFIKQAVDGDVEVNLRPRYINCSPSKGTIRVHADMVDMAAQEDNKAYAVRGMQRIHVSRSGLLASDGRFVASIDHTGRLI